MSLASDMNGLSWGAGVSKPDCVWVHHHSGRYLGYAVADGVWACASGGSTSDAMIGAADIYIGLRHNRAYKHLSRAIMRAQVIGTVEHRLVALDCKNRRALWTSGWSTIDVVPARPTGAEGPLATS